MLNIFNMSINIEKIVLNNEEKLNLNMKNCSIY